LQQITAYAASPVSVALGVNLGAYYSHPFQDAQISFCGQFKYPVIVFVPIQEQVQHVPVVLVLHLGEIIFPETFERERRIQKYRVEAEGVAMFLYLTIATVIETKDGTRTLLWMLFIRAGCGL